MQVSQNQPMERIKKVTEDNAKLSNFVHELEIQVEKMEKKFKEECAPLNKMLGRLGNF